MQDGAISDIEILTFLGEPKHFCATTDVEGRLTITLSLVPPLKREIFLRFVSTLMVMHFLL